MPLTVTQNYETETGKLQRTPVYFVAFSGVTQRYGTHAPPGISNISAYMGLPNGVSSAIVPEEGRASIGSIVATLNDVDDEITGLLADGLALKTATFYLGYWGLAEADFVQMTVIVDDYRMVAGTTLYEFTFRQTNSLTDKSVFEVSETTLNGGIDAAVTSLTVADAQFFLSAGFVIIDTEIIQYTGKTATTLTGLTRASLSSTAAAHLTGARVQEMIRYLGHPMDIAVSVMENTDKTGCGIAAALIDTAAFTATKTSLGSSYQFDFRITERTTAKEWLEREIYSVLACYPVANAGKLSVQEFQQPSTATAVDTIDETAIAGDVDWDGNVRSLINHVIFRFDYNVLTGKMESTLEYEADASITLYGRFTKTIESRGIRTSLSLSNLMLARAGEIRGRYKNAAPIVKLSTHLRKHVIQEGDIVEVTSRVLPNRFTSKRGVTSSLMEVVGKEMDWRAGLVHFTLLWTGWRSLAAVWAPESIPEFALATDNQRERYAFWADSASANDGIDADVWGYG